MKNQIVVITGGATGIGLGIARALIQDNTVISLDRTPTKITALKAALPGVHSIMADVTSNEALDNAIAEIGKAYGRIDLLINNAGLGDSFDFVNADETALMKNVETEIAVNYVAPIRLTKKALPLLQKSEKATVVVVSSGLAYMPIAFLGTYCASKSAAHFATMSMRQHLAPLHIRVVEVLPPVVDTELSKFSPMNKMPVDTFTKIFLKRLAKGDNVMNIGSSAGLEKFSRFFPKMAFKMMNQAPKK
jgi:uncharacterized oxidoreductase